MVKFVGNGDRAVLTTGAANGYGQIVFTFFFILRHQEFEHTRETIEEFYGTLSFENKVTDHLLHSRSLTQLGHEIRVG
jgi:hypothetical protein